MGLQGQIDSPGILEDKAEEAESQGSTDEDREAAGTETILWMPFLPVLHSEHASFAGSRDAFQTFQGEKRTNSLMGL